MANVSDVLASLGIGAKPDAGAISSSNATPLPSNPLINSLESQEHFLNYILRDPIVVRFPLSAKYSTRLVKQVLDSLGGDLEVHEELLSLYFEFQSAQPLTIGSIRSVVHKTWSLKTTQTAQAQEEQTVTLRMAEQLDYVGLTSWQAGFMLADFVSANSELFDHKRCLELGSGVGLTGIVLAKVAHPERLCLTDYTPEIINNMRINTDMNNLPDLEIHQLDWEQFKSDSSNNDDLLPFAPHIVLAADCVYDTDLVKCLCIVLKWTLSRPIEPKPVAYIATTLRNPKTFQFFLDQLQANNLEHVDVTATSKFDNLFEQSNEGIILSRITNRSGS